MYWFGLAGVGIGFAGISSMAAFLSGSLRSEVTGDVAAALNIAAFAAPLATMQWVFKTRDVNIIPLPMSAAIFSSGIFWTIYAILYHDVHVLVPNAAAILLGGAQLTVHIYAHVQGWPRGGDASLDDGSTAVETTPLIAEAPTPSSVG
mmetsp:Transcript_29760/g.96972  ORF Transcript_29760/g.96972 Transcript_29760/m.96972 type:complete len:148 (-) Transcript_29760:8-451(-)